MEIGCQTNGSIFLPSQNYFKRILKRFNFQDVNPNYVPVYPNVTHSSESTPFEVESVFLILRPLLWSLMFLAITTRPDIMFAVNMVSRFQVDPRQIH